MPTTWGLGVTARHVPNDNLGLIVEYASHVIFVPGNSSSRRCLIWYSPSDFLIKYWTSHLQITASNHISFISSKREVNSHLVQDHQGLVNILCYFLQYLFLDSCKSAPSGHFSSGELKKHWWLLVGSDFGPSGTLGPFLTERHQKCCYSLATSLRRGCVKSSGSETLVRYSMWSESLMVSSVVWMH